MTTLDDLLALLPDNETGQITAADLRTVVSELWVHSYLAEEFAYNYSNTIPPSSGNIHVNVWSTAVATIDISDTSVNSQQLATALLDNPGTLVRLRNTNPSGVMFAKVTAPATVGSGNRTLHVAGLSATGSAPTGNTKVSVTVLSEYTADG